MLDIKLIRENPEHVKKEVAKKGYDPKMIDKALALDKKRRKLMHEIQQLRRERNRIAKEIAKRKMNAK